MSTSRKAESALISVFHKDGLEPVVRKLHELGVTLYSTGGTEAFIRGLGLPVTAVEDLTGYPSILGGRVKTLHPKVFGGILGRRELQEDLEQLGQYEIPQLDIVVVDLYPFEKTVAEGASEQAIIEKIDIGGISLIRAAAKNYKDVLCVASMEDYKPLLDLLGARHLEADFARKVHNVRARGNAAKLHLALDGLPTFTGLDQAGGRIILAESMPAIEDAFDRAKYGEFAEQLPMEVILPTLYDPSLAPEGKHLLSALVQYAPRRVNGGVFLGLNGTVVKSHGSSDATGVSAAVKLAVKLAQSGFSQKLAARVASAGAARQDALGKSGESEQNG